MNKKNARKIKELNGKFVAVFVFFAMMLLFALACFLCAGAVIIRLKDFQLPPFLICLIATPLSLLAGLYYLQCFRILIGKKTPSERTLKRICRFNRVVGGVSFVVCFSFSSILFFCLIRGFEGDFLIGFGILIAVYTYFAITSLLMDIKLNLSRKKSKSFAFLSNIPKDTEIEINEFNTEDSLGTEDTLTQPHHQDSTIKNMDDCNR